MPTGIIMKKKTEYIIIHCSDSPNGRDVRAADILRWHTDPKPQGRGWHTAGYHYVVCVDGMVEALVKRNHDAYTEGWEIANGARGFNRESIHICMVGDDAFSQAQWDALHRLLEDLGKQCPDATVHGHHEFNAAKTCPNFDVSQWLIESTRVQHAHLLV